MTATAVGTPVADLVTAAARGDEQAWSALIDRYSPLVMTVIHRFDLSRADAADVNQTVWLRLVEHLDRLHDPDRVAAWLATTARHESLRTLRLASRNVLAPTELLPDEGDDAQPDASLLMSERDRAMWSAFSTLPERCQALLRMLVADPPPSYEEIGAALAMPVGSIGPTRARCLTQLRDRAIARGVSR